MRRPRTARFPYKIFCPPAARAAPYGGFCAIPMAALLLVLQAIGDIDEENVPSPARRHCGIPPAIHPLKRQPCSRTIHKNRICGNFDQAMALAAPHFIDQTTPKAFASKTLINWCRKNSRSTGKLRSIFDPERTLAENLKRMAESGAAAGSPHSCPRRILAQPPTRHPHHRGGLNRLNSISCGFV